MVLVIPALRKGRQNDLKYKASFGYIASSRPACTISRLCLKKEKKEIKENKNKWKNICVYGW
jgi:hypothetical protein